MTRRVIEKGNQYLKLLLFSFLTSFQNMAEGCPLKNSSNLHNILYALILATKIFVNKYFCVVLKST